MSFVNVCLLEIGDDIEEQIRYNSLATRLSQLEDKEFQSFMNDLNPNDSKKVIVDHEAQLKQFMQG